MSNFHKVQLLSGNKWIQLPVSTNPESTVLNVKRLKLFFFIEKKVSEVKSVSHCVIVFKFKTK